MIALPGWKIGFDQIGSGSIGSGHITSGTIGKAHMASGAVGSGSVGDASVTSGSIASGSVSKDHLSSCSVASGHIASGAVKGGVSSGPNIASGSIDKYDMGSGAIVPAVGSLGFVSEETISGFASVCLTSGGFLALAMAGSGLRMPAIGIVPAQANVLSGSTVTQLVTAGLVGVTSGLDATWSGQAGNSLFVGSGGRVIASGGIVSGQLAQKLGMAVSGGMYVNVIFRVLSGNIDSAK